MSDAVYYAAGAVFLAGLLAGFQLRGLIDQSELNAYRKISKAALAQTTEEGT